MAYYDYERAWNAQLDSLRSQLLARPLYLGGVSGSGGGGGGPIGGFVGQLPQTKVAYDTDEIASSGLPISGISLLDNLNHIRYRLNQVETTVTGIGTGMISVKEDGTLINSSITVLNFEGADVALESAGQAKITIPHKEGYIRLWDVSAAMSLYYAPTTSGLGVALAATGNGDTLYLPAVFFSAVAITITKNISLVGSYDRVSGNGTTLANTTGGPTVTFSTTASIQNVTVTASITSSTLPAVCIDCGNIAVMINQCAVNATNNSTGPAWSLTNSASAKTIGTRFSSSINAVLQANPFEGFPNGEFTVVYPTVTLLTTETKRLRVGSGISNGMLIDPNGQMSLQGTAYTVVKYTASGTASNPPTSGQLNTIYGLPNTYTAGFTALLNDGGGTNEYLVVSDGSAWFYSSLTKAA